MPTILERAGKMLRGEAPPPPVGRLLGSVLKAVEPGRAWSNGLATTTWPTSGTCRDGFPGCGRGLAESRHRPTKKPQRLIDKS